MAEKLKEFESKEKLDEDDDEEDDDEDEEERIIEGAYDPRDYENLKVADDVKTLFNYITCYTPQLIDLDCKLKAFIPDYIPAVGDIDAFIKIPRPDGVDDKLGLIVLDEPSSTNQSDSTLLNLRLRAVSKQLPNKKTSEDNDNNNLTKTMSTVKDIDDWIKNIQNLHETTKPVNTGLTLLQSQFLPDIETLMQEWDEEFEDALNQFQLPDSDLDCKLEQYVDIVCGILDIPVHKSRIASLHLLFSLYNEFQSSEHFKRL